MAVICRWIQLLSETDIKALFSENFPIEVRTPQRIGPEMDFHLLMIALVLAPVFTPVHCQVACNARSGPVRQKRIVLSSPGTGGLAELDTCQYRVAPWSGQVCQVRVDFERLELPQPQLNANSGVLECVDFLQIQHFRLCGRNSGQHLYIPIRRGQELQLLFRLATSLGRQSTWQLILTQLECPRDSARGVGTRQPEVQTPTVRPILPFLGNFLPRTIFGGQSGIGSGSGPAAQLIQTFTSPSSADLEMLAPLGCDQYYRTTTGGIVSFNFAGGVYMPNMKYSICVKGAADNEIRWVSHHSEYIARASRRILVNIYKCHLLPNTYFFFVYYKWIMFY